jgi:hypothetical protein
MPGQGGAWELRGAGLPRIPDSDDEPIAKPREWDSGQLWGGDVPSADSQPMRDESDADPHGEIAELMQKRLESAMRNLYQPPK